MIASNHSWLRRGLVYTSHALICALLIGAAASAQDDDEEAVDPGAGGFLLADTTFDSWAFGYGRNAADVQAQLERALDLQIDDVDRAGTLTVEERKKLELAGRADIKRCFEQVEVERKKLLALGRDSKRLNEVVKELQRFQLKSTSGFFDERSIFRKSLRQTIGADRAARYEQNERDRRAFQYRAKVEWVVAMLDNVMTLREEQRQAFIRLLIDETKRPKRASEYDHYVIMWQMSRLSEDKLKPLFDEAQWKTLNRQFTHSRSVARFLKQQGRLALEGDPIAAENENTPPEDDKK